MTDFLKELFGDGIKLTLLQMCLRTVIVFFIALLFIRISGRRSFGLHMPFDNVITILMGAILSRAVIGDSDFFPTIACAGTLALIHRICGWIGLQSDKFGNLTKGRSMIVYKEGELLKKNMKHCMVSKKDIMEGVRLNANTDALDKVEKIVVERNGEISVIEKENTK
jgi:uncharacterized membrane protein YcaP (DUF421 family)